MAKIQEHKFESNRGLNKKSIKFFILDVFNRSDNSRYNGKYCNVIFTKRNNFNFKGIIISKLYNKKYHFEYNYLKNEFKLKDI